MGRHCVVMQGCGPICPFPSYYKLGYLELLETNTSQEFPLTYKRYSNHVWTR